jgi:hypothetical protein
MLWGYKIRQFGLWHPYNDRSARAGHVHRELLRRHVDALVVPVLIAIDTRIGVLQEMDCQQRLTVVRNERSANRPLHTPDATFGICLAQVAKLCPN